MKTFAQKKQIYIYADWFKSKQARFVGTLFVEIHRGKEIFSFEYDGVWLEDDKARAIDPALQLFKGRQYITEGKKNYGIFLDSAPDRWGRRLMERQEGQNARSEKRLPRTLLESDFLLGVFDLHRMGALRFRLDKLGPFLDDDQRSAIPPWVLLRKLEQASHVFEANSANKTILADAIRLLLVPGSSLGGARPKASVVDEKGSLWIAKFPSLNDRVDVGIWEMLIHQLARKAGIEVPEARLEKFSKNGHTFITRRFDRDAKQNRLHFASAMTLLQRSDGDDFEKGASYFEFVEFLLSNGSQPDEDLKQLWRRIVFFVLVSNTDDHLRNHGFILGDRGWRLAPAYDMNPVATGNGLSLNISETDNAQDLDLLKNVAPHFRVKKTEVEKIISQLISVVNGWRRLATKLKISRSDQEAMANAFRVADSR